MISNPHLLYVILAVGGLLVALYATGNLSNTSNVVVLMLFGLLALALVVGMEKPKFRIPKEPTEFVEVLAT